MSKIKFAIVDTWPWGVKNAESEVINRIKVAVKNIGAELFCITKEGFIVNNEFQKTNEKIDTSSLDFIISMHYEDIKLLDAFHYHTLWNPPKIILQYPLYHLYSKNIASHDDFLIYDEGGMSDHLKTVLSSHPRDLSEASSLTASFSKSAAIQPEISENPVLFYCGINWERFIGASARHGGVFALLDKQNDVNLYGPEHSWDGYERYQGAIPFDGTSLIKEIHKCGVVLALSSDYHYHAGAATNRVYEACAGGAVIISDTNSYIMKHFGDSVLYIDFDKKHPENMFNQIKKHMDWIKQNPNEALKKAQKAQQIFLEKFSLETQLKKIISNHEQRKNVVSKSLYAQNKNAETLVILFLDTDKFTDNEKVILENQIKNIEIQKDSKVILAICCDKKIISEVNTIISCSSIDIRVFPFEIFDNFSNKQLARGQMFRDVVNTISHQYLMLLDGSETMFSTHITTLMRTLENNPNHIAAYSSNFLDASDNMRYPQLREPIHKGDFYNCYYPSFYPHVAGMFLMRSEVAKFLPVEADRYLDKCLPNALLNLAIFKYDLKFKHSQQITVGKIQDINIDYPKVMDTTYEINLVQGLVREEYEEWLASCPDTTSSSLSNELLFSEFDIHMFKVLRRQFRRRTKLVILLNYIRLLFVYSKKKRAKIYKKIEKIKKEYNECGRNVS